jgi:hypothetical protein
LTITDLLAGTSVEPTIVQLTQWLLLRTVLSFTLRCVRDVDIQSHTEGPRWGGERGHFQLWKQGVIGHGSSSNKEQHNRSSLTTVRQQINSHDDTTKAAVLTTCQKPDMLSDISCIGQASVSVVRAHQQCPAGCSNSRRIAKVLGGVGDLL